MSQPSFCPPSTRSHLLNMVPPPKALQACSQTFNTETLHTKTTTWPIYVFLSSRFFSSSRSHSPACSLRGWMFRNERRLWGILALRAELFVKFHLSNLEAHSRFYCLYLWCHYKPYLSSNNGDSPGDLLVKDLFCLSTISGAGTFALMWFRWCVS